METIQIYMNTLYWNNEIQKLLILEWLLKSLLIKTITKVIFNFNNKIYKQIDGVVIKSFLGLIFVNIFVKYCKNKIKVQN